MDDTITVFYPICLFVHVIPASIVELNLSVQGANSS